MKTSDFDFFLPKELIATKPLTRRDDSRLLVLQKNGNIEHKRFYDLPSYLSSGDMVILNNSKVFPARLSGKKENGSTMNILLVNEVSPGCWNIIAKGNFTGTLTFSKSIKAHIVGSRNAFFENHNELRFALWSIGNMPLPPYINRTPDESDKERYQTIYAEVEGSIAAPTAGLHFTQNVLDNMKSKGIRIRTITLHVGVGTFRPIRTARLDDHTMEKEYFTIDRHLLTEIKQAKASKHRIVAVGTTTTRALEGYNSGICEASVNNGSVHGFTDIFIHGGYTLRMIDTLITNFHLPRSTPLMLTAVLAGRKNLLAAYEKAVLERYRFFSYGDAMLVL